MDPSAFEKTPLQTYRADDCRTCRWHVRNYGSHKEPNYVTLCNACKINYDQVGDCLASSQQDVRETDIDSQVNVLRKRFKDNQIKVEGFLCQYWRESSVHYVASVGGTWQLMFLRIGRKICRESIVPSVFKYIARRTPTASTEKRYLINQCFFSDKHTTYFFLPWSPPAFWMESLDDLCWLSSLFSSSSSTPTSSIIGVVLRRVSGLCVLFCPVGRMWQ